MECDEEIPDSLTSQRVCSPQSPSLLANVGAFYRFGSPEKGFSSSVDSQETHLSEEGNGLISPVFEMQNHQLTSLSQATTTCEGEARLETASQNIDSNVSYETQIPCQQPENTSSNQVHEETRNVEGDAMEYTLLTTEIELAEKKIETLKDKLSVNECNLLDSSVEAEEHAIKGLIKRIALANKKEKEVLIGLRKMGEKISKGRLSALAQCHRRLVSIVQQQASLNQQIEEIKKRRSQDDETMSVSEYSQSQSLLPSSATCSKVEVSRTRIHSILKKNTDKSTDGVGRRLAYCRCRCGPAWRTWLRSRHNFGARPVPELPDPLFGTIKYADGVVGAMQKKMVKFDVPVKHVQSTINQFLPTVRAQTDRAGNVEMCKPTSEKSDTLPGATTQKEMAKYIFPAMHIQTPTNQLLSSGQTDSAMNIEISGKPAVQSDTQTAAVPEEAMDVSENDKNENTVSDPHQINIFNTRSSNLPTKTIAMECVQSQASLAGNISNTNCIESDDSCSLISGVSGFAPRQQLPIMDHTNASTAKPQTEVVIRKEVRPSCTIWSLNTPNLSRDPLLLSHPSTVSASELLNMMDLINRQLVMPGRDVMECVVKGRIHKASLLGDGSILGPHGITFHSPMIWVKGLSGLKQISYKGQTLYDICLEAKKLANAMGASGSAVRRILPSENIANNTPTFMKPRFSDINSSMDSHTQQVIHAHQIDANCSNQPSVLPQHESIVSSPNECIVDPLPQTPDPKFAGQQQRNVTREHKLLLVQDNELFSLENIFGGKGWESGDIPAEVFKLFS